MHAAAAVGVLVAEHAVEEVGHGLEAAVGVPRGALGGAGLPVDRAHLVHVDERVEGGQVDAGEGAAHGEALALEAGRGGGEGADGPVDGGGGIGLGHPRQHQDVVDGDRGHGVLRSSPMASQSCPPFNTTCERNYSRPTIAAPAWSTSPTACASRWASSEEPPLPWRTKRPRRTPRAHTGIAAPDAGRPQRSVSHTVGPQRTIAVALDDREHLLALPVDLEPAVDQVQEVEELARRWP